MNDGKVSEIKLLPNHNLSHVERWYFKPLIKPKTPPKADSKVYVSVLVLRPYYILQQRGQLHCHQVSNGVLQAYHEQAIKALERCKETTGHVRHAVTSAGASYHYLP